jgi:hypothetical protein
MEQQLPTILTICIGFFLADFYLIGGVRVGLKKWKFSHRRAFTVWYWGLTIVFIIGIFLSIFLKLGLGMRAAFMLGFFLMAIGKCLFLPFILIDDIRRSLIWLKQRAKKEEKPAFGVFNEGRIACRSHSLRWARLWYNFGRL